jgi:hypothetical protein
VNAIVTITAEMNGVLRRRAYDRNRTDEMTQKFNSLKVNGNKLQATSVRERKAKQKLQENLITAQRRQQMQLDSEDNMFHQSRVDLEAAQKSLRRQDNALTKKYKRLIELRDQRGIQLDPSIEQQFKAHKQRAKDNENESKQQTHHVQALIHEGNKQSKRPKVNVTPVRVNDMAYDDIINDDEEMNGNDSKSYVHTSSSDAEEYSEDEFIQHAKQGSETMPTVNIKKQSTYAKLQGRSR